MAPTEKKISVCVSVSWRDISSCRAASEMNELIACFHFNMSAVIFPVLHAGTALAFSLLSAALEKYSERFYHQPQFFYCVVENRENPNVPQINLKALFDQDRVCLKCCDCIALSYQVL